MTNNLPTVTIGIPAFNEEANIANLLTNLLHQKKGNFILEKIIVRSDGSIDKTNEIVLAFKSPKIHLLTGKRYGLAGNENKIIEQVNSDYLIMLNADVVPTNDKFIENTVDDAYKNKIDLGGINTIPAKTKYHFEKILEFGVTYKNSVFRKYHDGDNWFTCRGTARIFSKKFYKNFKFKNSIDEDSYSYLWCKKMGYVYKYIKTSSIFYKLAENLTDHLKQGSRYFSSTVWLRNEFGDEFMKKYYIWPVSRFLAEGIKLCVRNPMLACEYVLITIFSKFQSLISKKENGQFWNASSSTRKVPS